MSGLSEGRRACESVCARVGWTRDLETCDPETRNPKTTRLNRAVTRDPETCDPETRNPNTSRSEELQRCESVRR